MIYIISIIAILAFIGHILGKIKRLQELQNWERETLESREILKKSVELLNNQSQKKTLEVKSLNEKADILKNSINEITRVDYYYGDFNRNFTSGDTIEENLFDDTDFQEIDSKSMHLALKELRERSKASVKDGRATLNGYFPSDLNDKDKDKVMKLIRKLVLRTFNGEADAVISKISHRNIDASLKKIEKSFDNLQKLTEPFGTRISIPYYKLKVAEAKLAYEYEVKKQAEKEEQKAIAEQIREEQRTEREYQKSILDAEKEEKTAKKALDEARKKLESAHGEEVEKLMLQMESLAAKLKEAEENNKRAVSQAQLTKSGHVYIISNIGSFGEDVYKIGMTRRLEPLDRVKELGDASVPFKFDVHAMIFSEDAPQLESKLHNIFHSQRLNKINNRKEFFNVTLKEIEEAVIEEHGEFKLTELAKAEEYRLSIN